jgi:hypothetical protein
MTQHFFYSRYPPKSGNYFSTHFIMGGEKFDSPQPESFLFGENSGKYPPQVPFNIWSFYWLHLAKGLWLPLLYIRVLLFFSKSLYFWRNRYHCRELFCANHYKCRIRSFVKLRIFPLKNLNQIGTGTA